jgi:hypothetical protein
MNCVSCKIVIPVTYTKALSDNVCPACGKEIMSAKVYKEFAFIRDMLADADIDDPTLVKISAMIVGKFDLVPKGMDRTPARPSHKQPQAVRKVVDDDILVEDDEELVDLSTLSPEDAAEEMARRAELASEQEQLVKEWGLEEGQYSVATLSKKTGSKRENLSNIFAEPESATSTDNENYQANDKLDIFARNRQARLAGLKSNPSYSKISRIED